MAPIPPEQEPVSERVQRSRRPRRGLGALAAAAAVLGLAVGPGVAVAEAAGDAAAPVRAEAAKRCAPVAGKTGGTSWAEVEIVKRRNVSCRGARKVVRRCLTRRKVRGWSPIVDRGNPGLRRGKRRLRVRAATNHLPVCLQRRGLRGPATPLGAGSTRIAGPFEAPVPLPPTSSTSRHWVSPITSYSATGIDVGSANLGGHAHTTPGNVRSVWFEYGTTRDLGSKTEPQPAKFVSSDYPFSFTAEIRGLRAKTRYYWRAVANIGPDDAQRVYKGAVGSFVTEPYRRADSSNPCNQPEFGGDGGGVTQVTGALAIVCTRRMELVNSNKIVASVGYHGTISCPPEYPRNLNAGAVDITIPDTGYRVTLNNLVNYWRSNDSARFTTFPGYQKHYAGNAVGPLVGWHDWDIDQWGYLFSTSRTDVQLWIHCTDNWQAFTPAQLAPPQGDDRPSSARPATPTGFRFNRVDGGWKGTWNQVTGVPDGVAGYELSIVAVDKGLDVSAVLITETATEAFRSDKIVKAMADIYKTKQLYAALWAISGEGNRSAQPAVVPFTAP